MKQIKHIAKPFCALALLGTLPFASAAGIPAKSSIYPLYINGVRANTTGWLIHGNNYFKLRDIGKLINFSVIYDSNINAIKIETSAGYIPESTETDAVQNVVQTEEIAIPTPQTVYVNGRQIKPEGYAINGSAYLKLRDIGEMIPFRVEYDSAAQIVNLTTNTKPITTVNEKQITTAPKTT